MSDKVADLMLGNIQEVFNERDAARRIVAIKSTGTSFLWEQQLLNQGGSNRR